jgi:hypothetical protein
MVVPTKPPFSPQRTNKLQPPKAEPHDHPDLNKRMLQPCDERVTILLRFVQASAALLNYHHRQATETRELFGIIRRSTP